MQHVFILGCKGIPAEYGGFETFVHKLTQYQNDETIKYHVACATDDGNTEDYQFNGAHCHPIRWRIHGSARAILYDLEALGWAVRCIRTRHINHPIVYVLACRIGPFVRMFRHILHSLGGILIVNPDGHEWKRAKWNAAIRHYWKLSERSMIRNADLIICDSKSIEHYIHREYGSSNLQTQFIAYGAECQRSTLRDTDQKFRSWMSAHDLASKEFFVIVGRFVPENNYLTILREFMASKTEKSLAIVTQTDDSLLERLATDTGFRNDSRIKFVGTVYDQSLLKKIREHAFGYIHGHEVGGTNPSLLEALASTQLNLLLDVSFNREVAVDTALYWTKQEGSLAHCIERSEEFTANEVAQFDQTSSLRISESYNWKGICHQYESMFLTGGE